MEFHERHKLLLMAHSPEGLRRLGRLVASTSKASFSDEVFLSYDVLLWKTLKLLATVKKHANVLYHCMSYLKTYLSHDEKEELTELIEAYRQGHLPLIVPVTLINHYIRKYHPPYLAAQYYLSPHPIELHLRNHV